MIRKIFFLGAAALLAATACKKSVSGEAKASTDGKADASSTGGEDDASRAESAAQSSQAERKHSFFDPRMEPRLQTWVEGSGLTRLSAGDTVRVPLTRNGGQELYAYPIPDGYEIEENPESVLTIGTRNGREVVIFTPPKGAKAGDKFAVKIEAVIIYEKAVWPLTIALVD